MQVLEYAGFKFWAPVLINDQASYSDAAKVCEDGETKYTELQQFVEAHEERLGLVPVSDSFVQMGKNHKVFLWQSPAYPNDPNFMIGQVFENYVKEGNTFVRFGGIIGGDKFQGLLRYRKDCCGKEERNVSSYVTALGANGRVHVVGDGFGTKDRFKQLLHPDRNPGAIVFSTHKIEHAIAHSRNVACDHDHGNDLTRVKALLPTPAPTM